MIRLVQFDGEQILREIPLKKKRYTLGRGVDNDIIVDVRKVSRHHAVLELIDDHFYIIDQDSINHTYVNGKQVKRKCLSDGDTINLSRNVTFVLNQDDSEAEALTPALMRLYRTFGHEGFKRLQDVTRRIISLDSLDNILNVILKEILRLVGAERGFVALTDEHGEIQKDTSISQGIPLTSDSSQRAVFSHSIVRQAIETQTSVFILNTIEDVDQLTPSIEDLRLRSIMCAPLAFGDKLVGLLYVDSGSQLINFTQIDQFLFTMLANHAAIAIENAKIYSQAQNSVVKLKSEIQQSEQRYRQLVELSPDAIMVHCDDQIIFANQAAAKLLRAKDRKELLGRLYEELVHPGDHAVLADCLAAMEHAGRAAPRIEKRLLRMDGSYVEVESLFTPLDYQGKAAVLVLSRDVTERKKYEQILTRTQKLESVGVLAGGLAHDFNNILSVVLGNISLAKMSEDTDNENFGILSEAEDAARRARELTQQLLTFSRGGAPVKTSGSIAKLVKETAGFALRGSNVSGDYTAIQECPTLQFDEGQISQVVNNLVINATQAMPEGGRVELECEPVEVGLGDGLPLKDGRYVRIAVRDHGIGIPPDHMPKIFDPYFSTKQKGSGLGLAIAHSILAKHDGCIAVESELGIGTAFYIYLPITEATLEEKGNFGLAPIPGSGRILLMDDEETMRVCASRMLRNLGYEVNVVDEGARAVEAFREAKQAGSPFDAVIMDLTVPGGMGGKEALVELLKIDPNALAIVSSGYSNDPIMAEYASFGFKGVLSKPYDIEELSRVVHFVLTPPPDTPSGK